MNTLEKSDQYFMNLALKEAKKAFNNDEVPIGAVLVLDGVVISKAHNQNRKNNSFLEHAEINAMLKACKKLKQRRLDNTVLYITLEPCLMCVGAILNAHIKRVVVALKDHKNGAVNSVLEIDKLGFTSRFIYLDGVCANESLQLLQSFFKKLRRVD